jgi:hypothetical protein
MIEISDRAIRSEVQARLERDRESDSPPVRGCAPSMPMWAWHLIAHAAHVCWLLLQASS